MRQLFQTDNDPEDNVTNFIESELVLIILFFLNGDISTTGDRDRTYPITRVGPSAPLRHPRLCYLNRAHAWCIRVWLRRSPRKFPAYCPPD
ncbi:hypothetical protein Hanom_Chr15g01372691 [Helianthus anomalus]